MTTVRILVEIGLSGQPVHEDVPAVQEGAQWRLTASPGLAMGAAAGDLLRVGPDGSFDVTERGGNIAVHVSAPASARGELNRLRADVEMLGGNCDGVGWTRNRTSSLSVFTLPLAAGFAHIEAAMNRYVSAVPAGEWYYVNVYDPTDDTRPLNWWLD
ncbi:DUF4265 domain-containing protein [Kibdelosporangium phytohabitans]|uniref:DUF4265 domain-containing protein n=1 Tax=Kibdelosporangium phytohabitans TaxID=860235 RepID=UPI00146FCBD4|nr:DUF4265 domain-containing protein [Kibdelosporangium phytohabitans]MBE1461641.1 hypothetical protein [Kibdelosporangium phytohabitans]